MKFKTSYYARMEEIREKYPDYILVSISGGLDQWIENEVDLWDKRLAPKKDFFNEYKESNMPDKEAIYTKKFKEKVLIREDGVTINDIFKSWSDKFGLNKTFIILCYEIPVDFCHRHIVAEAIEEKYGVPVPEMFISNDFERIDYKYKLKSNFDTEEW